jgi:hypothetical protein
MTDDLGPMIMEQIALMEPILEAAKGLRVKLEADGWSPTAAETIAMDWLRMVFANAVPKR